jgi:FtsP/CotA-like multicopper oxidase with cupredoxin domain
MSDTPLTAEKKAGHGATTTVELEARPAKWEIAPGHTVEGFTFNGSVPGPTIEARVGEEIVIRLKNSLPEPTVVHWHGLRIPAEMDGTDLVQRLVEPGETFEYRLVPPDAGTYWYHSHANEAEQLERGLYGALIVRGEDEPEVDAERLLVLDDVKLNRRGQLARFGGPMQRHDGRQGETLLINGRTDTTIEMGAGQIERWRIVNAASARFARLSIGGSEFQILGSDGGLLPAPVSATEVLLTPGERVDVAVGPFDEGDELAIESLPFAQGMKPEAKGDALRFGTVRVGDWKPSKARVPSKLRTIEPLVTGPVEPNRTVRLGGKGSLRRFVDWTIDDEMHHVDDPVKVGELQVWDIVNETKMPHPFHLHGFFFQILDENGRKPQTLAWKDTVMVDRSSTVRIAWMPDDRPGHWMYHCHILEHHAAGMMATFEVVR